MMSFRQNSNPNHPDVVNHKIESSSLREQKNGGSVQSYYSAGGGICKKYLCGDLNLRNLSLWR